MEEERIEECEIDEEREANVYDELFQKKQKFLYFDQENEWREIDDLFK